MSHNRLRALSQMNKHLAVLLQETPEIGRQKIILERILNDLNDLTYYVSIDALGPNTKIRHMASIEETK